MRRHFDVPSYKIQKVVEHGAAGGLLSRRMGPEVGRLVNFEEPDPAHHT